MTKYCRLCAELKDSDEIVASIDDIEQEMEQKLRACCQWTDENTEHRLPHSVCSICTDKLEKSWHFSQSVHLAQQRLLEIFETDTKPSAADRVQRYTSNDMPSTSTGQIDSSTEQFIYDQNGPHMDLSCEMCAQEFQTDEELNEHRHQGCDEFFVEQPTHTGAQTFKCEPSNQLFTESSTLKHHSLIHKDAQEQKQECDEVVEMESNTVNTIDVQSTAPKSVANQQKQNVPAKANKSQQSDGHASKKLYPCDMCDRVYDYPSGLHYHRNTHTREQTFKCEPCNQLFASNSALKRHSLIHNRLGKQTLEHMKAKIGPYQCQLCVHKPFTNHRGLQRHLISHVNRSGGELEIDGVDNKSRIIRTNGGGDPIYLGLTLYMCNECNQIFDTKNFLKKHQGKCTGKSKVENDMENGLLSSYIIRKDTATDLEAQEQQQECDEFVEMESIMVDSKPLAVEFIETEGGMEAKGSPAIDDQSDSDGCVDAIDEQMTNSEHGNVQKQTLESNEFWVKPPFKCTLCDKMFKRKEHLRGHLVCHVLESNGELKIEQISTRVLTKPKFQIVRANGGGDPICIPGKVRLFSCNECDKVFENRQRLRCHQAKHSNERPFECWLCHKMFKTRNCVKTHMRKHVCNWFKLKSMCEQCGQAFRSVPHLVYHMQTAHSDERPFKCEICGLSFKIEPHLKVHLRRHNKEPQFKCNQCEKAFKSNYSLKFHLETHSGMVDKPIKCDYCGMGFRYKNDLKDHRSKHTGEKQFKCEHCASEFGARSSFYTHMRKVHGISLKALKNERLKT